MRLLASYVYHMCHILKLYNINRIVHFRKAFLMQIFPPEISDFKLR
jgi:hypothetical protein